MKKLLMFAAFMMTVAVSFGAAAQERDPSRLYAVIETNRGTMEFELRHFVAPVTVANFVNLATRGYYDGLTFHRVIDDFMIQGGDPSGGGSGGPGYQFEDEIALRHNGPGILSMANAGPDTNGSQFFITHSAQPHLNGLHTVFGRIRGGQEVIYEIQQGDVIESITIEGNARSFLEEHADRVYEWNQTLDENFPDLEEPLVD